MNGYPGPVTLQTNTVRVVNGKARLPGRYPHDFASIPESWRVVETESKYVVYPSLPPGAAGLMSYFGGETDGDALEVWGDRKVYGQFGRPMSPWRWQLHRIRDRIRHAAAALRGDDSECDYFS